MKKILIILIFILFSTNIYAGSDKILKSGFITKSSKVKEALNQYLQTKTIWISHS